MNFIEAVRKACTGEVICNPMYEFPIIYQGDEFWTVPPA